MKQSIVYGSTLIRRPCWFSPSRRAAALSARATGFFNNFQTIFKQWENMNPIEYVYPI